MSGRALALLVLGLLQIGAAALGAPRLRAAAAATGASPAPKVFTSAAGLETFSSRFVLEWEETDGRVRTLPIGPERYARLAGPYLRRNAYGAAVAYGPVLADARPTRPLLEAVMRHALCGEAPLLRELGLGPDAVRRPVRLRVIPRPGVPAPDLPLVLEAPCA